jgi:hypothetical protein
VVYNTEFSWKIEANKMLPGHAIGSQLVKQYETDCNGNFSIEKIENVITTVFHQHYKGGLVEWIQGYYEDAFTELVLLGQKSWNNDIKNRT